LREKGVKVSEVGIGLGDTSARFRQYLAKVGDEEAVESAPKTRPDIGAGGSQSYCGQELSQAFPHRPGRLNVGASTARGRLPLSRESAYMMLNMFTAVCHPLSA